VIQLDRVAQLVSRFANQRVLVVGDVMLDEYIYGAADRISPEAPVPVVRLEKQVQTPGGAANTAHNIATLGGAPSLVGVVGDDQQATRLRQALAAAGIGIDGIIVDRTRPTTIKTRIVAHGQQVLRIDSEHRCAVSTTTTEAILAVALPLVETVDAVVLCDYAKGVVTERVCQELLQRCVELGKPSVVDPKGSDYRKYYGA